MLREFTNRADHIRMFEPYYFVEKIKEYNVSPQFTIALNNQYVKYNFSDSFNDFVDEWNNDKIYDKNAEKCTIARLL